MNLKIMTSGHIVELPVENLWHKISCSVCSLKWVFSALGHHGINHKHERAWTDQIFEWPGDALKPLPRFRTFFMSQRPDRPDNCQSGYRGPAIEWLKTVPFHRHIYHNVYNDVFVISFQTFRRLFGTFQFLPMVAQLESDPKFGIWAFGLALRDWRYLDLTLVFKRCSTKIWIFINSTLLNTIEEKRKLNKILVFAKQFFSGATNFLSN